MRDIHPLVCWTDSGSAVLPLIQLCFLDVLEFPSFCKLSRFDSGPARLSLFIGMHLPTNLHDPFSILGSIMLFLFTISLTILVVFLTFCRLNHLFGVYFMRRHLEHFYFIHNVVLF